MQVETTYDTNTQTTFEPYKHDCFGLLRDHHEDGVYVIHPPGGHVTDTWCDMTNGGWTVIQRRMDGSENFNRAWDDYVKGFGNRTGEYWLGLENIHKLTENGSELVVYMEAFPGQNPPSMTAHYSYFEVRDSRSNYTLSYNGFNGTCGDALFDGEKFKTFEHKGNKNCAKHGGWWTYSCSRIGGLNGMYFKKKEALARSDDYGKGIHWYTCWFDKSVKFAIMKIRRKP